MVNLKSVLISISTLLIATLACNASLPQNQPAFAPTQLIISTQIQSAGNIPQAEANVPRISVDDAKAALDSGQAIIVDVRSADAFATGHVAGAISIPLSEIENNPTGLALEKSQWIITYCT